MEFKTATIRIIDWREESVYETIYLDTDTLFAAMRMAELFTVNDEYRYGRELFFDGSKVDWDEVYDALLPRQIIGK